MNEILELRLRYSAEGMAEIIEYIDHMKLGELPEHMALFLAHASNPANWSVIEAHSGHRESVA